MKQRPSYFYIEFFVFGAIFIAGIFFLVDKSEAQLVGGGGGTINTLDPWKSDGTNITQRTLNKPIKFTGLTPGGCMQLTSLNVATTTGSACGSGGGGTGPATSTNPLMGTYMVATSTLIASQFPYASSTAVSATTVCVSGDCRTAWPSAGSGVWPYTPSSYNGIANQSTTSPLWLKNTMIIASTTLFSNASSTNFTLDSSGLMWLLGITSKELATDSTGKVYGAATTTAGTGLTYNGTTFAVNSSQSIATLSNLTTNGLVTTSGSAGTLGVTVNGTNGTQLVMANGIPTWNATSSTQSPVDFATSTGKYGCTNCSTATAANPSASVGSASATNGSAVTFMRSDAAPACTAATALVPGCLAAADFSTFSLKLGSTTDSGIGRNMVLVTNNSGVITSSSTPVVAAINATSSATSTFAGGISTFDINETGTATSTFVNGIDLTGGCFAVAHTCISSGASSDTPGGTGTEFQYRAGASTLGAITNSAFNATGGWASFGTTTSKLGVITVASSTGPQMVLTTGNPADFAVAFRATPGGGLLVASSSYAATSTNAMGNQTLMGIAPTGEVFFGASSSPAIENGLNSFVSFVWNSGSDAYVTFKNNTWGKLMEFRIRANSEYGRVAILTTTAAWLFGTFGNNVFALWDDFGPGVPIFQIAQGATTSAFAISSNNHIQVGGIRDVVTVSSCGTSPGVGGNDVTGDVRIGTGATAACTVSFIATYSVAPRCFANLNSPVATSTVVVANTTATTIVFRITPANAGGTTVNYFCVASSSASLI